MAKTPNWQKRLELLVSIPASLLEDFVEYIKDYFEAIRDANKKELPKMRKRKTMR